MCVTSAAYDFTWYAPFYSGGGYCSEATAFMLAMHTLDTSRFFISHHGDSYNHDYVKGLTDRDRSLLERYEVPHNKHYKETNSELQIILCHSEPGAWYVPRPNYHTVPCPPAEKSKSKYYIGRTMFETDSIPSGWVNRLNYMDEIWVPTEFSKQIFMEAGVEASKLIIVGEPVDTEFFRPVDLSELPIEQINSYGLGKLLDIVKETTTVFLFVGKFEQRKGIDILLRSYYNAFSKKISNATTVIERDVILIILTSAYHSSEDYDTEIQRILDRENLRTKSDMIYPPYMILSNVKQEGMPYLYSFADALVSKLI